MRELEKNNNSAWMAEHKAEQVALRDEFGLMVQRIIDRMAQYDKSLAGLEAKDCIFRLNRDVRFSPDKRPYKNHFSAYMVKGGKKSLRSGYYVHFQPGGQSLIAGGVHCPTPEMLKAVRSEIAYNGDKLTTLITAGDFRSVYGEVMGERLKTSPKGYDADHRFIELLRMKDYDFCHYYTDRALETPAGKLEDDIVEKLRLLVPVAEFFNEALTDLNN